MNSTQLRHAAAEAFSNMIAFTGDIPTQLKPWQHAQALQDLVCRNLELVDEVYLYLTHQQAGNPNARSALRGWLLFSLVAASFVPSSNMQKSLELFLDFQAAECGNKEDRSNGEVQVSYINYVKATLTRTIVRGTSIVFSLDQQQVHPRRA